MLYEIIATIIIVGMMIGINVFSLVLSSVFGIPLLAVLCLCDFIVGVGLGLGWGMSIAENYYEKEEK